MVESYRDWRTEEITTGEFQDGLMSLGILWAVFPVENDSVGMERLQEGMQGLGSLGTISHKEYLNELQVFCSRIGRTRRKEKKMKYK